MKKNKKLNWFSIIAVVVAIVMMSATLTMAVLSDRKSDNRIITVGEVSIDARKSKLEILDLGETVTRNTMILHSDIEDINGGGSTF